MKKLIVLLCLSFTALSCTNMPSEPADQYVFVRSSIYTDANVEVTWADKDKVDKLCRKWSGKLKNTFNELSGCARSKPDNVNICEIIAVEPRSFDDHARLIILGHEFWHCLGALHT